MIDPYGEPKEAYKKGMKMFPKAMLKMDTEQKEGQGGEQRRKGWRGEGWMQRREQIKPRKFSQQT